MARSKNQRNMPLASPPRRILALEGEPVVTPELKLIVSPAHKHRAELFFSAYGLPITIETSDTSFARPDHEAERAYPHPEESGDREAAFRLVFDGINLSLESKTECGFVAGLQTVIPLLEKPRPLPRFDVVDWPAVKTRAFQMDLARRPESPTELKRLLRQQARHRFNQCQFYLENAIKLDVFGEACNTDGLTKEQFQDVQATGQMLGIDVVPSLNLLGHMGNLLADPGFAHLRACVRTHLNPALAGVASS